jgi:hypothetical protein
MKAKKIILLVLAAVLATLCKGQEIESYDLTEAQKQVIPYKNEKIVRFINDAGQTIDITTTKRTEGGDYEQDNTSVMRRKKFETLKSEPDNIEISLFFNAEYDYLSENHLGWLRIDIKPNATESWFFFFYSDKEGNLSNDHPFYNTETHKNLEINGKVYCDVVEQKYTNMAYDGRGGQSEVVFQLFYNKTYGILQVNRDGKNALTIVPDEDKGDNSPDMINHFGIPLAEHNVK